MNDYFSINAVSRSKLVDLDYHPMVYYRKHIEQSIDPNDRFKYKIGNAVDCKLTKPDEYEKTFVESEIKVSDNTHKLAVYCIDEHTIRGNKEITIDFVLDRATDLGLINFVKFETRKRKLEEENFFEYLEMLMDNPRAIILFPEETEKVNDIVNSILTNEFIGPLFEKQPHVDQYYQLPIYWKHRGCLTKVLLDKVDVDHERRVIKPYDIKTTASMGQFKKSYWKLRYDIQGSLYTEGLHHWKKDKPIASYKIEPFSFIVESTSYPGSPLIYQMTDWDLLGGEHGMKYMGVKYRGWRTIYDDLIWHEQNNIWNYTREQYENKAVMLIDNEE